MSKRIMKFREESGALSFEEWERLNCDELTIAAAESGQDRELDFDREKYVDGCYEQYLKAFVTVAPELNTAWLHKNGYLYTVLIITNAKSERPDEYPVTVVYKRLIDNTIWSRPLSRWHGSFTPVLDAAVRLRCDW
ncbi:MAG: hypothetical protein ACXWT0_03810 [Methylobacter sp.]